MNWVICSLTYEVESVLDDLLTKRHVLVPLLSCAFCVWEFGLRYRFRLYAEVLKYLIFVEHRVIVSLVCPVKE